MPVNVTVKDLLDAGSHFGHQTRKWNPKMKPYIFGVRNGVHIINLSKTAAQLRKAVDMVTDLVSEGADVIFVGTKRQAQEVLKEEAERCEMFHMTNRWLGGTLTNFRTIRQSIDVLNELERMAKEGNYRVRTKKEALHKEKERIKMSRNFSGISKMTKIPGVMFVIDPVREHIAVKEANKLGIPVIAVCDTDCNPDGIECVIPGNDDAIRSIRLFAQSIANACFDGKALGKEKGTHRDEQADSQQRDADAHKVVKKFRKREDSPRAAEAMADGAEDQDE